MDDAQRLAAHRAFARCVAAARSQSAFERATGAKQQKVSYWLRKKMLLPGEYVLAAESAYGVSRHDLRPDLYPLPAAPASNDGHLSPAGRTIAGGAPAASCDRSPISQGLEPVR
ncbi:YdaS family helix-turn-helix protein [Allosphingosinicella sp.]|uniref:YdaS family helix-turn-helix protein n=1 Tax=Allosphingosinicella sp. TaxID=2823234 RepID=UPI0032C2192D